MDRKLTTKRICKKPSEIYEKCPSCESKNIYKLEVDVICFQCGWDSTVEYVASGGMDHLINAYRDHFKCL